MKSIRKIVPSVLSLALALCLVLALAGCNSGSAAPSSASGDASAAQIDAPQLLALSGQAAQEMTSYDARMTMDMTIKVADQEMSTTAVMSMNVLADPVRMKMVADIEMAGASMPMEMYVVQDDEGTKMYSLQNGQWTYQEIGAEGIKQSGMDTGSEAATYLDGLENATLVGEETYNGIDCYVVEGVVTGDASKQALDAANMDSMADLGVDMAALLEDFSMPMTIYINKATNHPVLIESDATEAMNALFAKILEQANSGATEAGVEISHFSLRYEFSNIGSGTPFELPAEADGAIAV